MNIRTSVNTILPSLSPIFILWTVNYLLIEALERYDFFYGETLKVECPTGSGNMLRLQDCAKEISSRIVKLFVPDENGRRPCHGDNDLYKDDPHFKDLVLFYEYFHGDNGRGLGARSVYVMHI